MADGLTTAHAARLVGRDIKPNILVAKNGYAKLSNSVGGTLKLDDLELTEHIEQDSARRA